MVVAEESRVDGVEVQEPVKDVSVRGHVDSVMEIHNAKNVKAMVCVPSVKAIPYARYVAVSQYAKHAMAMVTVRPATARRCVRPVVV